ncbi:MAG: autotransporter-associated beta strand repeat-containing protein, partial [Verrucomicrobia bacterium]|nr:autotransporter-associated beta strand repeat-containing protein [Verrucomicrobiota bacterium]
NFTTGGEVLAVASTLNALRVTGGILDLGGAALTNNSGALLFTSDATIQNGTLRFPTNLVGANRVMTEGVISLQGAVPITAVIGGGSVIAGATNVVASGNNPASVLILAGNNTFTNLIVNNIRLGYDAETNLGGGSVTLAGGTLAPSSGFSTPTPGTHSIVLGSGGGTIDTTNQTQTYGGVISGAQNLTKVGTGRLTLTNANTFTGSLVLNGGAVRGTTVGGSLGAGNVVINGGNLEFINDTQISYARAVILNSNTTNAVGNLTALVSTNTFTMGALNIGNQRLSVTNGGSSTSGTNSLTYGTVTVTNSGAAFSVGSGSAAIQNQLNVGAVNNQGYNVTFETAGNSGRLAITGNSSGTGGWIFNGSGTNVVIGDNSAMAGDIHLNGTVSLVTSNANAFRLQNRLFMADGTTLNLTTNLTVSEINSTNATITANLGAVFGGQNAPTLTIQRDAASGPTTIGAALTDSGNGVTNLIFTKSGTGLLTLTANNTFGGALTVTGGNQIFTTTEGGELQVAGNNARVSGNASTVIQTGGTLTLGSGVDTVVVDRLADRSTLAMQTGNNFLNLNGANAAGVTREIVSNLTINTGMQTITLNPTAGNQVEFVYQTNFTRSGNSTLLVRGTGLGQAVGTADSSRFYVSAALGNTVGPTAAQLGGGGATGSKTISIISFMIGDTNVAGAGNTFLTYTTNAAVSTNGYRPLTDAEYESVNNLGSAAKTLAPLFAPDTFALSNFSLGVGGQALAGSATPVINALRAGGGTVDIGAGRVLTVDSGAILLTNNTTITGGTLLFNREAVIHSMGGTAQANVINSVIAGTGGLTFSANNPGTSVTLGGNNIFVGLVNINGDPLVMGNAGALNSFTPNSVTINSGRLALNGNSVTINALNMNGSAIIDNGAAANANLTVFSGTFNGLLADGSGAGTLGLVKNGTGTLSLVGNNLSFANSFSGGVVVNSGIFQYGSDHALGNGTLVINGGTINPTGNNARTLPNPVRLGGNLQYGAQNATTFQGPLDLGGAVRVLRTGGGQTMTFSGPVSNGGIIKDGADSVGLNNTNSFDGPVMVIRGNLSLNTPAAFGSTNGSTFVLGGLLNNDARTDLNGQANNNEALVISGVGATAGVGNGAIVNTSSTNFAVNAPVTLVGTTFVGSTNITINSVISGPGALVPNTLGTLTLTGSNTFTGAVRVENGTLTVNGNAGGLANASSIAAGTGTTLNIGSTADALAVNINRIRDGATVGLTNATFTLANGTNTTEVFDTLALAGRSVVTLNPNNAGGGSSLAVSNTTGFSRAVGAALLLRGTNMGVGTNSVAVAANNTRYTVNGAGLPANFQIGGGSTNGGTFSNSIVPWIIADGTATGLGTNFVTYSNVTGTGFRVLADTELFATNGVAPLAGPGASTTTNFLTVFGFTNGAGNNATVNALKWATASTITNAGGLGTNAGSPVIDLSGATLTNNSGTFLFLQTNSTAGFTITNGLIVGGTNGNQEIIFHVISSNSITVTNWAAMSNSAGGFTFAPNQAGTTLLLTNNAIKGTVSVLNGRVVLSGAGGLGTNNPLNNFGSINFNGFSTTNGGLNGLDSGVFSNTVTGTRATLTINTTNFDTFAGVIGTNITVVKTGIGTQVLTGAGLAALTNSFSNLLIQAGTVVAQSNANALGNGAVTLSGGNLTLGSTNNVSFGRALNVLSNGTVTIDGLLALPNPVGVAQTMGGVVVTNAAASTLTLAGATATTGTLQLNVPTVTLVTASTNFTLLVNNNGLGATTLANITTGVLLSTNTLTVDGSGNTTIAGGATGITNDNTAAVTANAFGLIKQGTGTLLLSGTNYFTNDFLILNGIVRAGTNALGLSTNNTAITMSGGTLQLAAPAVAAYNRNVTLSNSATIQLDRTALGAGVAQGMSNLYVTNAVGAYTLTVTGTNANSGSMAIAFTNLFLDVGNNAIFNVVSNAAQGANTLLTLNAVAGPGDTSASITKTGTGTLLISGANGLTFLGPVTNNGGIVQVGNATALGDRVAGTVVAAGATLDLNGQNVSHEPITIGGAGFNGQGTLISGAGTGAAGNLVITNDTTFGGAGNLTISNLQAVSTVGNLTKIGAGTLTIGGATNTYTGTLSVQAGTLAAGSASALGATAGGTTIGNGASFNVNGQAVTGGEALSVTGLGLNGAGAVQNTSATAASLDAAITQGGNTAYGVTAAGALTLTGAVGGSGTVTKNGTGAGFLNLQASNTYASATLVNGGTLAFNGVNGSALGSSGFTVTSNATLMLSNTVVANNGDRLGCVAINLNAGTFAFVNGGGAANYSETVGALNLGLGANSITSSNAGSGQSSVLNFGSLSRAGAATLNFAAAGLNGLGGSTNLIAFLNAPALQNGLLGGWTTVNFGDFATYVTNALGQPSVTNLSVYNIGGSGTWVGTDNAKVTAGDLLLANAAINSLTMQSGAAQTLDLGAFTLTNASGGILAGGSAQSITNGTLTAGPNGAGGYELVAISSNNMALAIGATIADNGANAVGLVLAGPGTNILAGNNTFTGGATVNAGTVNLANAGALNASGVNQLTVNGGTLDLGGNSVTVAGLNGIGQTIITNTVPGATAVTLTINNSGSNRYDGVIAGTNLALVKNGAGTQTLAGANGYTGQTVINAGVVELMANGALGATGNVTNNTTVTGSGAAVHINGNGLSVAELLSLGGTGIGGGGALRNLGGTNTWSGALVILTNGARINSDAGQLTLSGAINNGAFNLNFGGVGNLISTAVIGAGAGTVTKDGTGTLTLSGANTYTGGFIFNSGTVLLGNNAGLGTGTAQFNAGTLASSSSSAFTVANNLSFAGDLTLGQASGGTGPLTFSGQVDLGSVTRTLRVNNPSNIISGPILGSGGLTKDGSGALYLSGINPFTGPVTITNGSIVVLASGAFNSSSNQLNMGSAGRLTLNGLNTYLGSLAGNGGVIENANVSTNVLLAVNQTANTSFRGTLQDGAGAGSLSLVKNGAATLNLGGTGTYSGLTILNEGTLQLGSSTALGTNQIVFGTQTATLDLNGQSTGSQLLDNVAGAGATGAGAVINSSATPALVNGNINQGGNTVYGGSGPLVLTGNLSGTGGFTKTGGSILALAGSNSFASFVSVNGGTLVLVGTNALGGAGASPVITITNGATLDLNGNAVSSGKNIAAISGSGVGGKGALVSSAAGVSANAATNNMNVAMIGDTTIGGTGNYAVGGVVSGTNTALIKVGTNTITLGGANTYTGTTFINEGTLLLRSGTALGTTPAGTYIANGATLDLTGQTVAEPIWGVGGAGFGGQGAIIASANTGNLQGNVVLTNDTVVGGAANLTFVGIISGGSGLIKAGANTTMLTATNTYTGATVVNAGILALSNFNGSVIATSGITINSNATLTLDNLTTTNANRINDAATVTMNGGTVNFNVAAGSTGVAETVGGLLLGMGNNSIATQPSAGNSVLTFGSLARSASATVNFSGTGLGSTSNIVAFLAAPALTNNLIGGWATVGQTEFATYANGSVTNLDASQYNTNDPATWTLTQNVKVSSNLVLVGTGPNLEINSLNIQSATNLSSIDLGGNAVTNYTGGIVVSGATNHVLTNGILTAGLNASGAYEMIVTVSNGVAFSNYVAFSNNQGNAVGLVFAGAGTNVLRTNSFITGGVTINSGTVTLSNTASALGTNNLTLRGGTLNLNGNNLVVSNLVGTAGTIQNGSTLGGVLTINDNGVNRYSGVLADGAAGSLKVNKTGSGTLLLAGNNTFGGAFTNGAGIVMLGSPTALGGAGGGNVIASGATLDLNGQFVNINEQINSGGISGAGVGGTGAMINGSPSAAAWRGNFSMGGDTTVGGTGELTLAGTVSGAFGLTKIGANTLILAAGSNSFSGGLTINSGVVRLDNAQAITNNGLMNVTNLGTLRLNGNNAVLASLSGNGTVENSALGTNSTLTISNAATGTFNGVLADGAAGSVLNLTKTSTGTLVLTGANTFGGTIFISQGTLVASNALALGSTAGTVTIASGATLDLGAQNIAGKTISLISGAGVGGAGALVNNGTGAASLSGNLTQTGDTTYGGTADLTLSGAISGAGNLNKTGANTLTLSGANSVTGSVNVVNGTVKLGSTTALGSAAGVTATGGGTLDVNSFSTAIALTAVAGAGAGGNGAVVNNSGSAVLSGAITQSGDAAYGGTGALTLSGSVGGSGAFNRVGAGTLTLSGANTFGSGVSNGAGGTLELANAGALNASGVNSVINNGTLRLNGNSVTIAGLSGAGVLANNSAVTPAVLTVNNSAAGIYNGTLVDGAVAALGLTKAGTGTLTLNGVNTYSGTTLISGGKVVMGNVSALGNTTGGTTVGNVGTLDVNGLAVGAETITLNGGTLINDSGTPASLAGNVIISSGGTFGGAGILTVNSIVSGSDCCPLTKVGAGTVTLTANNTYTGSTIITAGILSISADANLGVASGLPTPASVVINGGTLQVTADATLNANRGVAVGPAAGAGTGTVEVAAGKTLVIAGVVANNGAGSGTLAKIGTGTNVLLGANTYGSTVISAGTVQVGNGGTAGTLGTGDVTDNAALIFSRSDSNNVANNISGTGSLTQVGAGTTVLLGTNTYGNTVISAGTLQVGNGGTNGTLGTGSVLDNAALVINRSDVLNLTGDISGTGSLTQNGGGTTVLLGANTYGSTFINSGIVQVGNGGTAGTLGTGGVTDNSVLVFNRSDSNNVANNISGSGALFQNGGGTTALLGANTYGSTFINFGTLQVGTGGTAGTLGTGDVTDLAALVFNRSDSNNVANNISGGGSITQNGSGVTTFLGTNTLTGLLTLNAGTAQVTAPGTFTALSSLTVNAATLRLTSNATVTATNVLIATNGTLAGNGAIIGNVTNLGTISAGASPGSLTINGNLNLASTANMTFELGGLIATNDYDVVNVTNFVQFAGNLSLKLINGWTPGATDTYTLMTYNSFAGAFLNTTNAVRMNDVSNSYSFLVTYSATNLVLSAPLLTGGGTNDTDGDGQSDAAEIAAGTDPNNPADYLHITSIDPSGANYAVQWASVTNKNYQLYFSTNLNQGLGWQTISTNANATFTFPDANHTQWIDDGTYTAPVNVINRFYKVGLQ